jgi:hypothetical protein
MHRREQFQLPIVLTYARRALPTAQELVSVKNHVIGHRFAFGWGVKATKDRANSVSLIWR